MCFFNNPTIHIIECISWIIKYFLLLIHDVTMKKLGCSYVPEDTAQVEFFASPKRVYMRSTVHVDIREFSGNPNPKRWNLMGRGMAMPPSVSSPRSVVPPTSSHCAFIATKENSARFSKLFCNFNFLEF